ncbi:MAG TPA: OmpA family protein [Magnetospirillaceae bacterium]|jgi:OOP family OmpA-OmpF porin
MKAALKLKYAVPFTALLALAGCADFPNTTVYLDRLNANPPSGTDFNSALANEYKAFANEEKEEYDWFAQQFYARKGWHATQGQIDPPEDPANWSFDDRQAASDLVNARARLMTVLSSNAPTRAPQLTATAQVKFECWLHEQHEGWQQDEINECKKDFNTAMDQLLGMPKPAAAAPAPAPAPAAAPANYMVFFDFDKSMLTPEAHKIIATAAQTIKAGGDIHIKVTGYTDTVGTVPYNLKLSVRRAKSVDSELIKDGIPAANISMDGKGKSDLLVPTDDGVREPKNRRAVIEFTGQ